MPRQHIIINVRTGEREIVPYTPAEEAAADAAAAQEALDQAQRAEDEKDVTKIPKMLKAIALWVGDLHGKTPAEVKNEIRSKYESLP